VNLCRNILETYAGIDLYAKSMASNKLTIWDKWLKPYLNGGV
jgi:hypothetical protein